MTIKHNGNTVLSEKTVRAKGALLGAIFGGPRTISLRPLPDSDDSLKDTVRINSSYGSHEVMGRAIRSNPICQKNEITWSPFSFKER